MTADPTGFDRLVVGDFTPAGLCLECRARHGEPLTAAELAAVLVTNEGLRRDNEQLRADLAAARRQAADLDDRLTRMTHESAARDRVAPMTAWPQEDR